MSAKFLSVVTQGGYTLIEIMVMVTILVTVAGAGLAAFSTFSDRQQTLEAAKTLQSWIKTAQSKAQALEKPAACGQLHAYRLEITAGSNQATLSAICNTTREELGSQSYELTGPLVFDTTATMDFEVLRGGVSLNGGSNASLQLVVENTGLVPYRYGFVITKTGEIREGNYL